jgi:hypothetical protein
MNFEIKPARLELIINGESFFLTAGNLDAEIARGEAHEMTSAAFVGMAESGTSGESNSLFESLHDTMIGEIDAYLGKGGTARALKDDIRDFYCCAELLKIVLTQHALFRAKRQASLAALTGGIPPVPAVAGDAGLEIEGGEDAGRG